MAASCGYHFTASSVSFGKGQSAVHKAAYNARCELKDERGGRQTRDYEYLGETLFDGIFAPQGAPSWAKDRDQLWNRAEAAERQKLNGQPARNIEFAFPHELNQKQREYLLKDFVREQFVRSGMIADATIHSPHPTGDQRNFHAHVLVTMRELDGSEFARTKNRTWNSKEQLWQWRERWAEMGARALERNGHDVVAARWLHGHRTLPEQRKAALERGDVEFAASLDRQPATHRGPVVDAMKRKGIATDRVADFQQVANDNAEVAALKAELAKVEAQIAAERELSIQLNEAAMIGPGVIIADAVKAKVGQALDGVMTKAAKVKEAILGKPREDATTPKPEKLDWRRYTKDSAYRSQIDAQQSQERAAKDRERGSELER